MLTTLPCLKCGQKPDKGLEFVAYGHHGSASFDPMDGSRLILNLCDKCVRMMMGELKIKKLRPRQER